MATKSGTINLITEPVLQNLRGVLPILLCPVSCPYTLLVGSPWSAIDTINIDKHSINYVGHISGHVLNKPGDVYISKYFRIRSFQFLLNFRHHDSPKLMITNSLQLSVLRGVKSRSIYGNRFHIRINFRLEKQLHL